MTGAVRREVCRGGCDERIRLMRYTTTARSLPHQIYVAINTTSGKLPAGRHSIYRYS